MDKKRKSKTLRLSEEDVQAILRIRQAYAIATDNQAIVFAIHQVDQQLRKKDDDRPSHAP
jgi:hypothetical protein